MYVQQLFLILFFLLISFQNSSATTILDNCPTITVVEETEASCNNLGSALLNLTNVNDGFYNIDYEGGVFENIEVISGEATLIFLEAGTYTNLNITIEDCTSTENPSITIVPINTDILSLNVITPPQNCDEYGEVDFEFEGYPGEIYTLDYSWRESGEPSGGPGLRLLSSVPAGTHFIALIGDCYFFTDTLFFTVAPHCTEVWPGDANQNGQVDYLDALSVILKNGKSGPIRPNASTEWMAQLAPDWEDDTPDGIDAKHADCDGDGIINPHIDALAIDQNYGAVIPNQANSSPNSSLTQNYILSAERSRIQTFGDSKKVTFNLKLKNNTDQDLTIAGLGFSATFENGINPYVESINSELGVDNDNLFTFSKIVSSQKIDAAIGRTDGQYITLAPASTLLITKFIIDENIVTLDQDNPAHNSIFLNFNGIMLQDNQGTQYQLGGSTASSNSGNQSDTNPLVEPLSIAMTASHVIDCSEGAAATIIPAGGVPPYEYLWDSGQTTASVEALNPGTYYTTLSDAVATQVAGLIVVEGAADCPTALPMLSLDFQAIPQTTTILLKWKNYFNHTERYDLERSTDGLLFQTIKHQIAHDQTHLTYQFEDSRIEAQKTYYYRLKMIQQGEAHFSNIVTATLTDLFSGICFYPNPVQNELTLTFEKISSKPSEMIIFNSHGQEMQRLLFQDAPQFLLDFTAFSSGLYFITVIQDGKATSFKILKT